MSEQVGADDVRVAPDGWMRLMATGERSPGATYQLLAEHSTDMISRTNAEGLVVYASPAAERLLGWRPNALLGASLWELVHPDDVALAQRARDTLRDVGSATLRMRHRDGSTLWVESNFRAIRSDDGALVEVQSSTRDVTLRREAEEHLRHSEAVYRMLAANLPDAMVLMVDRDLRLLVLEGSASWLARLDREAVRGRRLVEVRGDVPDGVIQMVSTLIQRGLRGDGLDTERELDGQIYSIKVVAVPATSVEPEAALALVANVTGRRRIQQERIRLAAIVTTSADAIISATLEGRIDSANPAAARLYRCPEPSLVGRDMTDLVPPLRAAAVRAMVAQVIDGGLSVEAEGVGVRTDGTEFAAGATISPITEDRQVVGVSAVVRDISARKSMEEALRRSARVDDLTGLPNRRHLIEQLDATIADPDRRTAVVLVRVEGRQSVEETLGHTASDEVLVECARRCHLPAAPVSEVAWLGGDELVVVLDGVAETEARTATGHLLELLAQPVTIQGASISVRARAGIVIAEPGAKALELLRDAHAALRETKKAGLADYHVFRPALRDIAVRRLTLAGDLRHAIANDELTLAYQPIVHVPDGVVGGVEALCRWDHPRLGRVSPAVFIPLAEETGLIGALGHWVLVSALSVQRRLLVRNPRGYLSVNVSAIELRNPNFAAGLIEACRQVGVPPSTLTVEVTESALIVDLDAAVAALGDLQDTGIRVAIDDFGTGWSSISRLRDLPFDVVKVDRALVPQDDDAGHDGWRFMGAILGLAEAAQKTVIVEGVETARQVERLSQLGIRWVQGNHFWRPLDAGQLAAVVGSRRSS